MELSELSDIYLPENGVDHFYAFSEGKRISASTNSELISQLKDLLGELKDLPMSVGDDKFLVFGDLQYRVHLESKKTETQFSLRKIPSFRPQIDGHNEDRITFPSELINIIKESMREKGGLYLISGSLGSGKTTTAAALFNFILSKEGGVGWALENPPEYDLEGEYGDEGVAFQHEVRNGNFATSIRSMMRCYPAGASSLMLIGEVRDSETAKEVLKALLNGTRVIFTFHSGTAIEAVTRFMAMCEETDYARGILAQSLRLLISQQKAMSLTGGITLNFEYLIGDSSVRSAIHQGKYSALKDIQITQKNQRNSSRKFDLG